MLHKHAHQICHIFGYSQKYWIPYIQLDFGFIHNLDEISRKLWQHIDGGSMTIAPE
jgi:hypothetical protein